MANQNFRPACQRGSPRRSATIACGRRPTGEVWSPEYAATQAERFDARGRYVRRWVPELANLPDAALYAPWTLPAGTLAALAPDYPDQPLVDPKASREQALEQLREQARLAAKLARARAGGGQL